jgi:hypothetical protein
MQPTMRFPRPARILEWCLRLLSATVNLFEGDEPDKSNERDWTRCRHCGRPVDVCRAGCGSKPRMGDKQKLRAEFLKQKATQ